MLLDPALLDLVPDAAVGAPGLRALLALPRGLQPAALAALRARLDAVATPDPEAWNTAFGEGSLFEAWTRTPIMSRLYAENRRVLRPFLDARPTGTLVEVGGGNGALWRGLLTPDDRHTLVIVDPMPSAHEAVARAVAAHAPGVRIEAVAGGVPEVALPEADAIVCSLTLHHVAGRDADARFTHGLSGPGKHEALVAFADALRARGGLLLLHEADVHCDLELPSGDPILRDRLIDSYVRRCASGLLPAVLDPTHPADLRARWWTIVRRWCLDQVDVADLPAADRDVYELDVGRWLTQLDGAGLAVEDHRFTDDLGLFHRYLARPRARVGDAPTA